MSTRPVLARMLQHELRLIARARATPVVCLLLVVVCAAAVWNGARWVRQQHETVERVRAADDRLYDAIHADLDRLARLGDPRPPLPLAGMAWYIFQPGVADAPAPHIDPRLPEAASSEWVGARHAVLEPAPLAALAIGQSDLHPFYTRVTIRTQPVLVHSDEIENPVNLLNGRFDLAFVLTFAWPLLVLPLLYDVLSEERERGTLALVAAQPVSLRVMLAVRLAVRLGLPVALTIVTSIAALAVAGVDVAAWWRPLAVWSGAVAATAMFWGGVAAVVNLVCRRSAAGAVVLMACWLGAVVVAPAVIGEIAAAMAPVPSRVELVNAVRNAGNLSSAELNALVGTYYEEHDDALRTGFSADETAIRGLAQQDEVDRRIGPVLAEYRAAARRQQQLVDRLRFVSPPLAVYDAVTELAGTTAARYAAFAGQVDRYHRAWRDYFYPLVRTRTSMTRQRYDEAPRFAFQNDAPGTAAGRALALVAWTVAVASVLLAAAGLRAPRFSMTSPRQ